LLRLVIDTAALLKIDDAINALYANSACGVVEGLKS
jgi:hypothetical protein